MTAPACMGGWCTRRDRCPHHHAADRRAPAERLCLPRQDGVMVRITHQGAVMRQVLALAAAGVPA